MRNIKGDVPQSAISRFLLGAGIGVAISVPIFWSMEDVAVRVLLMAAFAGLMGGAQVIAGGKTERSQRILRWAMVAGTFTLLAGVVTFFVVN